MICSSWWAHCGGLKSKKKYSLYSFLVPPPDSNHLSFLCVAFMHSFIPEYCARFEKMQQRKILVRKVWRKFNCLFLQTFHGETFIKEIFYRVFSSCCSSSASSFAFIHGGILGKRQINSWCREHLFLSPTLQKNSTIAKEIHAFIKKTIQCSQKCTF